MPTVKLIWRGFGDALDHLLPFAVWTLAWWGCLVLILPAPAATITLATLTDPRRTVDRPDWRDALAVLRRSLKRGWVLALLTVPIVAVLVANLSAYGTSGSRWSLLVPLWAFLLLLALATVLYAFAIAGLTQAPIRTVIARALLLVVARPLRAVLLIGVVTVFVAIGGALVIPLVLVVPALCAAIINRLVLDGLGLPVIDPLAPTAERLAENQRRANASRWRR